MVVCNFNINAKKERQENTEISMAIHPSPVIDFLVSVRDFVPKDKLDFS